MASEKQWYVVNTYSGHEDKVKVNLERRVVSMGLEDYVFRIIVAETEQPVLKDGVPTGKTKIKRLIVFRDNQPHNGGMPCGACREFLMQLDKDNKDMEILTDYETRTTIKLAEVLPNWWGNKRYNNN